MVDVLPLPCTLPFAPTNPFSHDSQRELSQRTFNMCSEPVKILTLSPMARLCQMEYLLTLCNSEPAKVVSGQEASIWVTKQAAIEPCLVFPRDVPAIVEQNVMKQVISSESLANDSSTGFCSPLTSDKDLDTEDRESTSDSKSDQLDSFTCQPCNKGSRGHPDFCARPCLYFRAGNCVNGTACDFCHHDHEKQAAHLDKRNRSNFSKLSFAERVEVILPIITERAQLLNLTKSLESIDELKRFVDEHFAQTHGAAESKISSRENRKLKQMLKCLRMQELVKRLKSPETPPSMQLSIDVLACQLQDEGTRCVECRPGC